MGMGKPTIKDVARQAGVSLGTASRVINRFADVNPELKRRVEEAIAQLGYTPDAVAQSMRLRSTRTIGILIRDISSGAFASFAGAAQAVLFREGYVPLLAGYNDEPERELDIMRAFGQRRIDGLIVTTSGDRSAEITEARKRLGVPTIMLDRDADDGQDIIAIDHRGGIRQALQHLFALGHRRIALLTGQAHVRPTRERVAAFKRVHTDAGVPLDPTLIRVGSFSGGFAEAQTAELLARPDRPTALIAGGVNMLPGAIRAIRHSGLRVPQDVSLISSTNPEIVELVTPSVTELSVDYGDIGQQAARLMIGRLDGTVTGAPRVLKFPTRLIERASCGPVAAPPSRPTPPRPATRRARAKTA